ncbi:MAG: rod shape-determining protein MreD [Acidocella sp.]|nr:rod shape-determining protein MreD [Acidocella sp.]
MARRASVRRDMNIWRRLDMASRYIWPAALTVFGLLIIGVPLGLPGLAALRPAYVMACVYFWSLYRPSSLPAPVVALTGLLLDLLGMSPLGMWAVLLLLLQGATLLARRRLISFSFLQNWLAFSGLAAVVSLLAWALQSLLDLQALPLLPLGVQIFVAIGVYPLLAWMFIKAHRGAAAVELA